MSFKIKINYQFHPYYGEELEIVSKPRKQTGTFTVIDREGKSLKVPYWMTEEQYSQQQIEKIASINIGSLLTLHSLLDFHYKNTDF